MDPDKVKIPGLGFDPMPSSGSSIFSLISSVNKGILKQPAKGILKTKSKYSTENSAESYSFTEPHLQQQQNEDDPDFPVPVQKALAVAERLSQVTQFSAMQQRKHGAFLAAKSAVEQIQLGLWKPQEKEKEKIQQAAVEAERKSLPPSRFNRPGQNSERPGLGYKTGTQSSNDFYTPAQVQRPKTQTQSSTVPVGSQEFKQPLPVNKFKQAKSLVDYEEDIDIDDQYKRGTLDISRKKALEEIDKYRSIPVDKIVSNQSDIHRSDHHRYRENSPERTDESSRYRKDSYSSDSRSYRYEDSYDYGDMDNYDKRSKDDGYRYDHYDDYDDDDDRCKRHRDRSERYDKSYDRYERDIKSCDKDREDYDRSRRYERSDAKYTGKASDFSEHGDRSHRSKSAESRSSSQSCSGSYQGLEDDNRAYETHRDRHGDDTNKAPSSSFSKASDMYVGDYEAYKKDIQLRTLKNTSSASASKASVPAAIEDAEKATESRNLPFSNVFDYGHSRSYQNIEEKSRIGHSYGKDNFISSQSYGNQSEHSKLYDEPYRSTLEKESFADQYGNTWKENESQRNTYGNFSMTNAAKQNDYNKGNTENARQSRGTDQEFTQYGGGLSGSYDTRYDNTYSEGDQFRAGVNSHRSQLTNADQINADNPKEAAVDKGDQLYEDFLFGNDNNEGIKEQDKDNQIVYFDDNKDDDGDKGRRFSEQKSTDTSSSNRTGGELQNERQWNYGTQSGSYGSRDKQMSEDTKISQPAPRAISPPGYKCKDCNVSYTIKLHYDAHLQSDSHLLTLQKKAQELFKMTESKPARQSRFDKDITGHPLAGLVSNIPGPVIPMIASGSVAPLMGQSALPASIGAEGRRGRGFTQENDVQVIPPKPMGPLEAESIHSTWIRVAWGKLTRIEENMIDQYVIEYRNARETHWVMVGQTENHSYTVNGLQENTDYLIRVYAMNGAEKSDILESVLLTTKRARRDSPGRRSERGRSSRFSDDRDRERQERDKQRQHREKADTQKERKAVDGKKEKENYEAEKKAKVKEWQEVKKGFNLAARLIMTESKSEEKNPPAEEKKEEKGEVEKESMETDLEVMPKVEEEKVECQLYKDLHIIKNSPALGLDYIVEVVSYKPVPSHFICKLCNNKGSGPVILKHIAGSPHKMEFFKKEYPEIHDKLMLIAMKKERIQMMDYEGRLVEDRVGRGAVKVHRMCNPADNEGKLVFKEPVSVPAPPPKRKKECKTEPSYTVVTGQFQTLYDEAVENGLLKDSSLIGLKYIIEYLHPQDKKEQSKFRCTMCSCMCSAGTIFYHITGKKHRVSYFKERYPDFVEEVTNSKDKSLIHTKAAMIEAQEGHSIVKVVVPKNGNMWKNDRKDDTAQESVKVNVTIDSQSGDQSKEENKSNQSGKQPIKFGLKKTEAQSVTMTSGNVLEQAKKKGKEEFDWNKENAELQAKIQNQSVIKCSRPSKFITVYSGFFQRYPVIGMQWVTEFQKPDPKLEPWYMCFMCQQKITWKSIIDHVTSNKHRLNYLKKNCKSKYNFLLTAINSDKTKARTLVEQFSRQVLKAEGTVTTMEVMLELNINTEALKSVMKIKDVKATSTVTSATSGKPTTTTAELSSSSSSAAAAVALEVAPADSTVLSSTVQLPVSSQSVASSTLQAVSVPSTIPHQSLQMPSQAPAVVGTMPGFTGSNTSMAALQPALPITSPVGLQRPAPVPLMSLSVPSPVNSLAHVQHYGPQPLPNTGPNMASVNYNQPPPCVMSSALSQPLLPLATSSQPLVVQAPGTGPMSAPSTSLPGSKPPPWQRPNNQSQVRYGSPSVAHQTIPRQRMHPQQIGPQPPHSHPTFSQPPAGPSQIAMTAVSSRLVSQPGAPRFGTSTPAPHPSSQGPPLQQSRQQPLSSAPIGLSSLENPIAQVIQKQAEVVLTKQILTTGTFPPPGTNVFESESTVQNPHQNYSQGNQRSAGQGQQYDSNKRKSDGPSQLTKGVKRSRWNEDIADKGFRFQQDKSRSFGNKRSVSPINQRQAEYENSKRSRGSVGSYDSKRSRSPSDWKSRDSRSRQRSFSPASERSRGNEPDRIVRLGKKQDRVVRTVDSQEDASSGRFGSGRSDGYGDNDVDLYYDDDLDDMSQGEFDRPLSPTQLESLVQHYNEREGESYDDIMRDLEDVSAFDDRRYDDYDRNRKSYERDRERSDRRYGDYDRRSDHDRYGDEYDRQDESYDRDSMRDEEYGRYSDRGDRYSHNDDRYDSRDERDDRRFDDKWEDSGSGRRWNERGRDNWNRRKDRSDHGDRREGRSDHGDRREGRSDHGDRREGRSDHGDRREGRSDHGDRREGRSDHGDRREGRSDHGERREGRLDHGRDRDFNRREEYDHDGFRDMTEGRDESNRYGDERYRYDERSRDRDDYNDEERGGNRHFDDRMDDRRRDERSWDHYDDDSEMRSAHERGQHRDQTRDFRDGSRDGEWDDRYQDREEEDNLPDPSREEIERLMQRASSNMRFSGGERRGQSGGHSAQGFASGGNRGGRGVHGGPRGGTRGGRGRGNFRGRGPRGGSRGRGGPPRGR